MKVAFVFSGQGSQYPQMGKDLYEEFDEAKEVFNRAGEDIKDLCFNGSAEELAKTENTQPCMYTVTMATYIAYASRCDTKPYAVAGFSLGEFAALTVSGVMSFETGLDFVKYRGEQMSKAAKGGMIAALGDRDTVLQIAKETGVQAVNFNCATQTVVAGNDKEIALFDKKATERGLKHVTLGVSGAFHSKYMADVSQLLKAKLEQTPLNVPKIPIISNVTADYYGDIKDLISRQVASPVQWEKTIERLITEGVDTFVEIGVGKVLCGFIKKINRGVKIYNIDSAKSLNRALEEIG